MRCLLPLLFSFCAIQAQTFLNVGSNSTYTNISSALAVAQNGDTLVLAGETFVGAGNKNLDLSRKNITIQGSLGTVLDLETSGRAFYIVDNGLTNDTFSVQISGVVIRRGDGHSQPVDVTNRKFGGAVYIRSSYTSVTFTNVTFEFNSSPLGGAIYASNYAIDYPLVSLTFVNVRFTGNSAADPNTVNNNGGAIYVLYGDVTFNDVEFRNNAADQGGAIAAVRTVYRITNGRFATNTADQGGAILQDRGSSIVTATTFTSNSAAQLGGGALWNRGGTSEFTDCDFLNNNPQGGPVGASGGAISVEISGGGVSATNCRFIGNNAGSAGGAIWGDSTGLFTLTNCNVTQNYASQGGAIYIGGQARGKVENSRVTNNNAVDGGAFYLVFNSRGQIVNTVVADNTATANGGGIYCGGATLTIDSQSQISNTNTAPSNGQFHCATITSSYCKVEGTSQWTDYCQEPDLSAKGLSSGAKAGIAIGVVLGVFCIVVVVLFAIYFADQKHREKWGLVWNVVKDDEEKGGKKTDAEPAKAVERDSGSSSSD